MQRHMPRQQLLSGDVLRTKPLCTAIQIAADSPYSTWATGQNKHKDTNTIKQAAYLD
jgi:hypothetical protein